MLVYRTARAMQLVGMILLPVAIAGEAAGKLTLRESLALSALGVIVFALGWSLQQFSR
ncbi:MAG: hypothetical protein NZO58_06390 [Gemmataceae bacterium]|nr:hypothetical protein [Gemmataceae bacterium]